jgi:outer membrane lipoprotein-sorting protein
MLPKRHFFALLILLAFSALGSAQAPPDLPVEEIIKRFSEKEKEFKRARESYAYRQEMKVEEFNPAGSRVIGEFQLTTEISFDAKGNRVEKVVSAPLSTLQRLHMTPEDHQDMREIQPFVLTSDDIGKYNLKYMGKEKIDEIDCYVFEVGPKKIEKDQRYFEGKIWVDDLDFQIVKTFGKAVPDKRGGGNENLFPKFETYREPIDGYWFPTYTRADDTLRFSSGAIRMRTTIRYRNYKQFGVEIKLKFGGEVSEGGANAPAQDNTAPALDPRLKLPPEQRK